MIEERLVTYIDSLSHDLPDYLYELEKEAMDDGVPIIRRSAQTFLQFMVEVKQPERILEIGTAVGFSTMIMSHVLEDNVLIDTIEKVPDRIGKAEENFKKYNKENIRLLKGDAYDLLEWLVDEKKKYDFVFMDAAKGQYLKFLGPLLKLVDKDGIIITDNVLQNGDILESKYAICRRDRTIHGRMRDYLYELTHNERLKTAILPVGDGLAITKILN